MIKLSSTNPDEIVIAVGSDSSGKFYVQTADISMNNEHSELSECIQDGLDCKEHALAIAKMYTKEHNLLLEEWA